MFRIILIRSGTTEYDEQGRIQGTLNIPLSKDGRRKTDEVILTLSDESIAAIYTSPCQSSKHVAKALGDAKELKPKTLEKLQNLDHGLWQGMLVEDVKVKQPKVYRQWQEQPETVCPPNGETVCAAKARIANVLIRLAKKYKNGGQIAIVVPEPLHSLCRHVLRRDALGDLWHATPGKETPAWERIDVTPELIGAR